MSKTNPSPRYFPSLDQGEEVDLSPRIVERIALVLGGIDPSFLDSRENQTVSKSRTIQQIRFESGSKNVSPSRALLDDHRYLLWPQFPVDESDFESLWKNSRSIAGGQESSVLVQHVRWLRKLDLNFDDNSFRTESDTRYLLSTPELSSRILFFLFRTALRHIERDATISAPTSPKLSRIRRIMIRLGIASPPAVPLVFFPETMLQEAEAYVETSMKLGRVIRAAVKRSRRARAQ